MIDLEIRDAMDDDLPGVLRVLADSGIDGGQSFEVEDARAHLARIRAWPNFRLFAVVSGGEVVGTYALLIMDKLGKRGTPAGVVEDVAVAPAHQGKGIGRAMMAHALEECRKAGCYKLALSSNMKRADAHRFYESLGFTRHGYSFAVFLQARRGPDT
ncbi:MAG TPA: GNAT family N-acetyltransferase [Candidatus Acidoferrales bacterium]|nr:GNAT family N-acetyltransferase [Candidatus Acidoferrales bacterium]